MVNNLIIKSMGNFTLDLNDFTLTFDGLEFGGRLELKDVRIDLTKDQAIMFLKEIITQAADK